MEGGVDGIALHRELALPGDELLPGQRIGALKEGLKVGGHKLPQEDKHSCSRAQVQIQPGNVLLGAGAQHPAVFRPHVGKAQLLHLVAHQALHPQQGGNDKLQFPVHIPSSPGVPPVVFKWS